MSSGKIDHHDKSSIDYYKVKRDLDVLKSKRGYHTELISLYIPPSRPLAAVIGYLRNEISESSNIKSKSTRTMVTDSITSLIARLKIISDGKVESETGFILFDGFIPLRGPGTEKEEQYVIIPPENVRSFIYHCASEFLTAPLEEMIKDKATIGIISIERNESAIGTLRGKHVEILDTMTSGIHGKHRAGGQSQHRFERLIEEAAREFYKRVGEHSNTIFGEIKDQLDGILIGGPGLTKQEFLEGPFLRDELKAKVLKPLLDTDGGGETGVRGLLYKAQDLLRDTEYMKERKAIDKFMDHVARDTGLITYGLRETIDALANSAVEILLLSEGLNKVRVSRVCNGCGKETDIYIPTMEVDKKVEDLRTGECPECKTGFVNSKIEKQDTVEYLGELAAKSGASVRMISTATEQGKVLHDTFGGVAGFLRYKYSAG
ncbi:MAG: peptide chain release factor aRF-1 [Candidatus Lokiarchaeota archaeon]|nr:peptide chain release factor aRF-1 [Candidatus Lokiarchaeota archaeon]